MNRPKFHLKVVSMVMLITFCNTLFFPTAALALTSGPVQAEYIGYESGATDMVQLLTGDLAYSLPVMSIPSPEGGFSFPLSYSSGIQPNQQASWVGLGWSLNLGAITRSVSMFPDDSKGGVSTNHIKDPGHSGLESKSPGGILRIYYDYSQPNKGKGGIVNLGIMQVGFGSQEGFSGFGLTYKRGEKPQYNFFDMAMTVAAIAAAIVNPPAGMAIGASIATTLATDAITAIVIENIVSAINEIENPYHGTFDVADWTVTRWTTPWKVDPICAAAALTVLGPIKGAIVGALLCMRKEYHWTIHLDQTKSESMYGSLYLGNQPSSPSTLSEEVRQKFYEGASDNSSRSIPIYSHNTSSDMYMNLTADQLGENDQPSHVAYDNYQVMGENVSGSISPYRHDIGTLTVPDNMGTNVDNFAAVPYTTSKVHFNYLGDMANEYRYHADGNDLKNPTAGFSYTSNISNGLLGMRVKHKSTLRLNEEKLHDAGKRTEANRTASSTGLTSGLKDGHLGGSKHVIWYSNTEIKDNIAQAGGFMDMHEGGSPSSPRTTFRNSLPQDGIGGFKVIASDGTTYHYALPVYVHHEESYTGNTAESSFTKRTSDESYASTWLLTAITGPDFYDRGTIGVIDEADWGKWVKMDYGKFAADYSYRTPYHNKDKQYGPNGEPNGYSYTYGEREVYYLDRVQTRSHTALFVKNLRTDAKGHYYTDPGGASGTKPTSALKLEEIILLTNAHYNEFVTTESFGVNSGGSATAYGQLQNGETIDAVIDLGDIDDLSGATTLTGERSFLNTHQIQRVVFNHNNDLCQGTLNSFDFASGNPPWSTTVNYTGKSGKLTLNSIATYGRNNVKSSPDYEFEYSTKNPDYHVEKWDKWGWYWSGGTGNPNGYLGHDFPNYALVNKDQDYWHLKKIITPTGSEVEVDYERDTYSRVSGSLVGTKIDGGDIRVKQITVRDEFEGRTTSNLTTYEYDRFDNNLASSGVVSKEPPWSRTQDYAFYHLFDYPNTPILYENVAVFEGVKTDGSYLKKTEYAFETPHYDKYQKSRDNVFARLSTKTDESTPIIRIFKGPDREYEYVERASHHKLYSNLWSIGRMNSVKSYNNRDHLNSSIKYNYIDGDNYVENSGIPGLRTHGSFVSYKVDDQQRNRETNDEDFKHFYNTSRTTKVFYPNILSSMEIMDEGGSYEIKNTSYDFYSGIVLEREYEDALGYRYRSKIIPAHHVYPEMGDPVNDPQNKNMLTQPYAEYLQVLHNGTYEYIKAVTQTWTDDWGAGNNDAYRLSEKYIWSDSVQRNGAFKTPFAPYGTTGATSWKRTEKAEYDNYSFFAQHLVGTTYRASRRDNTGVYVIASADNAKYGEFTFSDAELDLNAAGEYNGGLKPDGTAARREAVLEDGSDDPGFQAMEAHTGDYVYKVPPGSSIYFETVIGSTAEPILPGKVYRLSFWQHEVTFNRNPNIITEIFGGTASGSGNEVTYPGSTSLKVIDQVANSVNCTRTRFGEWHLVEMDITMDIAANQGAKSLKVELENPESEPIYIDDFRFLPLDATMEASVLDYESGIGRVRAQLDNQNIGTKYSYYSSAPYKVDLVKEVFKEEIDEKGIGNLGSGGFKKVLEKDYNIVK